MSGKTGIEWTDATWNPVVGCDQVSPGCAKCYAKTLHDKRHQAYQRGAALAVQYAEPFEKVQLKPERLADPLHWRKPRRVFVNSVSDLFHEAVQDAYIDKVFAVMALAERHTFQVLTKRADRMAGYLKSRAKSADYWKQAARTIGYTLEFKGLTLFDLPLPNVWMGVSVENQRFADERIPLLLQTPAAVRFISAEPLLGDVDLGLRTWADPKGAPWSSRWVVTAHTVTPDWPLSALPENRTRTAGPGVYRAKANKFGALHLETSVGGLGLRPHEFEPLPSLDWVIVGGESGNGARPFDIAWARAIIKQCNDADVPVFVKQIGELPTMAEDAWRAEFDDRKLTPLLSVSKRDKAPSGFVALAALRKGGHVLDWPTDLQVRQFPRAVV